MEMEVDVNNDILATGNEEPLTPPYSSSNRDWDWMEA